MALTQVDLKKIIAYSSISHMGFVLLGLFSLNYYGLVGSIYIMFSHGLVSGALFYTIGILYDRYKTKNILEYGGLASPMPIFSFFFFVLTLANISFPLTSNFSAEIITLLGVTEVDYFTSGLTTFSMVFTLIYSI
jgi:NADH-quinone oxidoreductase subunit M